MREAREGGSRWYGVVRWGSWFGQIRGKRGGYGQNSGAAGGRRNGSNKGGRRERERLGHMTPAVMGRVGD